MARVILTACTNHRLDRVSGRKEKERKEEEENWRSLRSEQKLVTKCSGSTERDLPYDMDVSGYSTPTHVHDLQLSSPGQDAGLSFTSRFPFAGHDNCFFCSKCNEISDD